MTLTNAKRTNVRRQTPTTVPINKALVALPFVMPGASGFENVLVVPLMNAFSHADRRPVEVELTLFPARHEGIDALGEIA